MTEKKILPIRHRNISIIVGFNDKQLGQLACIFMKHYTETLQ